MRTALVLAFALLAASPARAGGDRPEDIPYICDGLKNVTARFDGGAVMLLADGRSMVLPQGLSGSGARFTDGKALFWIKGRNAMLDLGDGVGVRQCRVKDSD